MLAANIFLPLHKCYECSSEERTGAPAVGDKDSAECRFVHCCPSVMTSSAEVLKEVFCVEHEQEVCIIVKRGLR